MNKKKSKIEFFNCEVCYLPYPTTGKFVRSKTHMCANCFVKNKRMFMAL